jgi:hypothetical protein
MGVHRIHRREDRLASKGMSGVWQDLATELAPHLGVALGGQVGQRPSDKKAKKVLVMHRVLLAASASSNRRRVSEAHASQG